MPNYNKFLLGTDGAWFALLLVSGFAIYNMFTGAPEMVHLMSLIAFLLVGFYYSCAKTLEYQQVARGIEQVKYLDAQKQSTEEINRLRRENEELRATKRQLTKQVEEHRTSINGLITGSREAHAMMQGKLDEALHEIERLKRFHGSPTAADITDIPI